MDSPSASTRWQSIVAAIRAALHAAFLDVAKPVRRHPYFAALFLLGLVINLVPVWDVTWAPVGDFGGHLELMAAGARDADESALFGEYYWFAHPIAANTLSIHLARFFWPFLDPLTVGKLIQSWYVVGLPLSALALTRAFGRSAWLAFLTMPLGWGYMMGTGFLNFQAALPLLFFAVAVSRTFAEHGGIVRGFLIGVLLTLTFFAHAMVFAIAVGICFTVVVVWIRSLRSVLRLSALVPPIPLFFFWVHTTTSIETDAGEAVSTAGGFGAYHKPLALLMSQAYKYLYENFHSAFDELIVIASLAIWIGLISLGRQEDSSPIPEAPAPDGPLEALRALVTKASDAVRFYLLEIIATCCMIAYFMLPSAVSQVQVITERVITIAFVFFAVMPRVKTPPLVFKVALVAIAWLYPLFILAEYRDFEEQHAGLEQAISDLPDGTVLGYLSFDIKNDVTVHADTRHLPKAIHTIRNGGVTDDSFAWRPTTPIQYRPHRTLVRPQPEYWTSPNYPRWDYLLVRSKTPEKVKRFPNRATVIFEEGPWILFELNPAHELPSIELAAGRGNGTLTDAACPGAAQGLVVHANQRSTLRVDLFCENNERARSSVARGKKHADPQPGGEIYEQRCHDDEVLVGTHGRSGDSVDRTGAVCAKRADVEAGIEWPERQYFKSYGGRGGHGYEMICPRGMVVRRVRGRMLDHLSRLAIVCEPIKKLPTPTPRTTAP